MANTMKRAIILGPAPDQQHTPLAYLVQDNTTAAAYMCGLVWLLCIIHTFVMPYIHRLLFVISSNKKHSRSAVAVHKVLLTPLVSHGDLKVFSAWSATLDALVPPLALAALCAAFTAGSSVDPALSDIGLQRLATLSMPLMSFSLATALRNSPLDLVLGIPFERTLLWHRWSGVASFAMLLAHGSLYWRQWVYFDFVDGNLAMVRNQWGLGALCLLALMFLTSLSGIRRAVYSFFYTIHILVVPCLLTMSYLHAPSESLVYLTPPLAFYVVDKGLRMIKSHRHVKVVELAAFSDPHADTSLITICAPPLCGESGFKSGQYLFINVPEVSSTKWHPVSFASNPIPTHSRQPTTAQKEKTSPLNTCCQKPICGVTIVLSGKGPFTRSLNTAVTSRLLDPTIPPLTIQVDGPYGRSPIALYKSAIPHWIYCAGGIGVTPVLSMLMERRHDILASGTTSSMDPGVFVWTVRHLRDVEWALEELVQLVEGGGPRGFRVIVCVTREEASDVLLETGGRYDRDEMEKLLEAEKWVDSRRKDGGVGLQDLVKGNVVGVTVEFGRPDFAGVLRRERERDGVVGDFGVVVSGPLSMVADVRRAARTESSVDSLFHVFCESFEL
ncbi:hypothetical protein BCR33DRAFT_717839 [Rhizoclosmatium globosum]|uniref:FAD-binding FR-type domain-containing protein n=1 Tax=Rhizoclosmatium globosum TaxID=329046 RepID=A0A1Y2C898_9FUNG|nr:hypothetical protein BCR33DRAFT_717839 [Rhizoclosmatium globosum]|eukprot:ORY43104.1 hypothetical protein BCR33DRAFT_717839 [Rhizoclosmatium globosum]